MEGGQSAGRLKSERTCPLLSPIVQSAADEAQKRSGGTLWHALAPGRRAQNFR